MIVVELTPGWLSSVTTTDVTHNVFDPLSVCSMASTSLCVLLVSADESGLKMEKKEPGTLLIKLSKQSVTIKPNSLSVFPTLAITESKFL